MSGWETVTLAEVCTNIQDGAHRSPQVFHQEPGPGRFLYITSKNIRNGYMKLDNVSYCEADFHEAIYRRCNAEFGDVLLTKDGASTGNVTLNTLHEPISLLSSVCLLKTDPEKLVPAFLYYYIRSDHGFRQLTGKMTGAAIKRIILRTIKKSEISLPCVAEQKRIVSILDEAFSAIAKAKENAEKNLLSARELFESYLNRVFTQQGPGWQEKPLGEVVTFQGGSQPPKSTFVYEPKPDYIRLIQIRDYKSDKKITFISEEKARRRCDATDIMIGRYGPPLFQILRGIEGAYNVALMKTIPNEEIISKDYLYYFLKNRDLFNYIDASSSRTAGQTGFKKEVLEAYPIGYPEKPAEQARIVGLLEDTQAASKRLETIYTQKLANLDELKQSLLQKAFTGQLTALQAVAI